MVSFLFWLEFLPTIPRPVEGKRACAINSDIFLGVLEDIELREPFGANDLCYSGDGAQFRGRIDSIAKPNVEASARQNKQQNRKETWSTFWLPIPLQESLLLANVSSVC